MPIDYTHVRRLLDDQFGQVEAEFTAGGTVPIAPEISEALRLVFQSTTQAYREVLLGCVIARIQDKNINIRLPYINLGEGAFNGRTLDERVVNPFLQQNRIPSSRAPYLSAFRRSVRFDEATRQGLRDQVGYDAFLELIAIIESEESDEVLNSLLRSVLFSFLQLREISLVSLARPQRLSLEQYERLISGILRIPSGGRVPVLLVVSAFQAFSERFRLNWDIAFQGINVADSASGVTGDITVANSDGDVLLAVEVTERPIDRSRVEATFNTKIVQNAITDYVFLTRLSGVSADALQIARQCFAQGHEVNFLDIQVWLVTVLASIGSTGRGMFTGRLIGLLDQRDIPRSIKVAWNQQVSALLSTAG